MAAVKNVTKLNQLKFFVQERARDFRSRTRPQPAERKRNENANEKSDGANLKPRRLHLRWWTSQFTTIRVSHLPLRRRLRLRSSRFSRDAAEVEVGHERVAQDLARHNTVEATADAVIKRDDEAQQNACAESRHRLAIVRKFPSMLRSNFTFLKPANWLFRFTQFSQRTLRSAPVFTKVFWTAATVFS